MLQTKHHKILEPETLSDGQVKCADDTDRIKPGVCTEFVARIKVHTYGLQ